MKRSISLRTVLFSLIVLMAFFENWLVDTIPIAGYFDEILALYLLMYCLVSGNRKANKHHDHMAIIAISLLIVVWGIACNFYAGIQKAPLPIIEDIMSIFKFLFVYYGLREFLQNKGLNTRAVLRFVMPIVKIYCAVLFVFAIANLFTNVGMHTEMRYGFRSFAFIYGVSGHIINQGTYFLVLLSAENEILQKKNTFWKMVAIFLMACTVKSRAFELIAVYFALYYFFIFRKKRRMGLEIGILGAVILLVGYSQFEYYFLREGTPRQMLVAGAVKLVREYFPFGTGFGTYGSSAAAKYYSSLYSVLGFSNRYGMTADSPMFLNDNYLPMIFAQFGLIVAIVFIWVLYKYSKAVLTDEKRLITQRTKMITWFFLANVLLSSIQSSFLASYTVVDFTIMFVLFFYPNRRERQER